MHKARYIVVLICAMLWVSNIFAQSDDIELTDSTSTNWNDGTGGGFTPLVPNDPVTSLTLSQSQLTLEGGQRMSLIALVNPGAKNKKILWTSANSKIASVDDDGTVMGLAIGTTTITATAAGNTALSQTCQVTVTSAQVLIGDVNGDGSVSVTDVGMIISYILEKDPVGFIKDAADVNGDGDISVTDVGALITKILSGE